MEEKMNDTYLLGMMEGQLDMESEERHPLTLAYLGDAVYELFVRNYLLSHGLAKSQELQKEAVRFVSANAQAEFVRILQPALTEEERDIIRKGRNCKSRNIPKNSSVSQYRYSTGLEALIGQLYLRGEAARLTEIMKIIFEEMEKRVSDVE